MTQEMNITGSFIWTFDDVKIRNEVLAGRPVTTGRKVVTYIITFVAFAFLFVIPNFRRAVFSDPYIALISIGGIIVAYIVINYSQRANLKKAFLQSPDSNKRIEVMFTGEEIILSAEGIYENKWKWNMIKDAQQYPDGLCFFMGEHTGIWIPIRAFQSKTDIDAVMKFAKQLTIKFGLSA
jgi:hypothetical protein